MPKSKLIVANWKSNKNREGAARWIREFGSEGRGQRVKVVICPAFPSVSIVSDFLKEKKIDNVFLGVQDISQFQAGAYTGAVSAQNLVGFDVSYAIIGHSERRRYFNETVQIVAQKIGQCLENDIQPILCLDGDQIQQQAMVLDEKIFDQLIIAYEPIEFIGTGKSQSIKEVLAVVRRIRQAFGQVKVLYGGSVDEISAATYLLSDELDGVLVGGASLDVDRFGKIVGMDNH